MRVDTAIELRRRIDRSSERCGWLSQSDKQHLAMMRRRWIKLPREIKQAARVAIALGR